MGFGTDGDGVGDDSGAIGAGSGGEAWERDMLAKRPAKPSDEEKVLMNDMFSRICRMRLVYVWSERDGYLVPKDVRVGAKWGR